MSGSDPAFPVSEHEIGSGKGGTITPRWKHIGGLTKRELFAAMAMQGFLSCTITRDAEWPVHKMVESSVIMADALLAELEKKS